MKLFFQTEKGPRRGMALIMVLAVLVLISALVIGFLLSTTTELKSSKSYASGAATRHLADSAVQLVVAQITDATKGTSGSGLLSWASQPGMIRTYNQTGSPDKYYKLYSSDSLIIEDGASFSLSDEAPPANWDTQIGLYTDLNAPVLRDNKVHFPIIDPRAKSSLANQSVEGFDYTSGVNGVVLAAGTADAQRLPMPVRWLYVLEDGKFATPSSGANGTVTFDSNGPLPTDKNPIVGRIAFWTDDDSSKININTASEGTFWDRPWANNTTEQNFATAIPAQNEFQRYPGHPAKTSLSTVLGPLLPSPSPAWYLGMTSPQQAGDQLKAYYDLTPRVADGGTRGGTINEKNPDGSANNNFVDIRPDADRLYASVDEFLFSATRAMNNAAIDSDVLERSRFFLTAHNRAPELNLFGKPRMTLWPLQQQPTERNVKDKLIAFCSEIGGRPYYFQRLNVYGGGNPSSQSTIADWADVDRNQQLYNYLDFLTQQAVPGFGASFASKYPRTRKQILTEMFDQIRSGVNAYSTGLEPPYSYAPSYLQTGSGQVVPLVPNSGAAVGTHGFGRFPTIAGAAIVFFRSNAAYVETTVTGTQKKMVFDDRYKTSENPSGAVIKPQAEIGATLILNPMTVSPGFPPWSPDVQYEVTGLDKFTINGARMGFPATLVNKVTSRIEYSGQGNTGPFFGVTANFRYNGGAGDINKSPGYLNPETQYPFIFPIAPASGMQLPEAATAFDFNKDADGGAFGHTITIKIYAGTDVNRVRPIQTIDMTFPPVEKLPVPTGNPTVGAPATLKPHNYIADRINKEAGATAGLKSNWRQKLIQWSPANLASSTAPDFVTLKDDVGGEAKYWASKDVARGVEANIASLAQGDYRVYAALSHVPESFFAACDKYDFPDATGRQMYWNVQTLRDGGNDAGGVGGFGYDDSVVGGLYPHFAIDSAGSSNLRGQQLLTSFTTGVLIPKNQLAAYAGSAGRGSNTGDQEYRGSARPAVPQRLPGAYLSGNILGDWDNATGLLPDGPYINKPDEGNSDTVSDTTNRSGVNVYYGTKEISGGYFSTGDAMTNEYVAETGKTFSPNRQVASAVLFGSLPTGIDASNSANTEPWRTLLFCPNPLAKGVHPGRLSPPDHLFLDLFTMPVVEPYAISEPFSTAGKVNMNYQIMPFGYITRDTGVRAVLKASRIMAIPQSVSTVTSASPSYKDGQRAKYEFRYDINPDRTNGTLAGFEQRFSSGDIFRSASEICNIFLVPKQMAKLSSDISGYPSGGAAPTSYGATASWWDSFLLTGDNTREAPYGDIYARLTTKSNTYTIHYKVQSLKKIRSTAAGQWVEGRDQVTGEIRGSTTVERYIDLGNPDLKTTDFASPSAPSAEGFYKIHTIGSSIFNP